MAEFVFNRGQVAVITMRVPKEIWDQWEFRHRHFGKALHALRETAIEVMGSQSNRSAGLDAPDPFFREVE